jgi:hypothetical protein
MPTVFYSWQSDRRETRNFIRSALDDAAKALNQSIAVEEPDRQITIDQDTQGLPGSPPIAVSILQKIRSADIFVADLTLIDDETQSPRHRRTPNPNVMLEYGYALHAPGDSKIVGVFNEAFGSPTELPFDLAHRRWPIRFSFSKSGEAKQQERQRLTAQLGKAIGSIISQFGETDQVAHADKAFTAAEPGDGVGRLRHAHDYLCIGAAINSKPIWLPSGPYAFLRLVPTVGQPDLAEVEAYKIAQAHLQPMTAMRTGGWQHCRHESGTVSYYAAASKPEIALDASQLFLSRELWANNFYYFDPERDRIKEQGFSFIPTGAVEEMFLDTLINFMDVAKSHLAISLPVEIFAGLVAVNGFALAVDRQYFGYEAFAGKILRQNVLHQDSLKKWTDDPFDSLLPFFEKIYGSAGIVRPKVRTTGRRQR